MNTNNGDMPAMPNESVDRWGEPQPGLTKREHFAAMAMQGAWWELTDCARPQHFEHAAASCVAMADALLKELAK